MSNVPTQRQVIHSGHPPRPNQTKKLYLAKPTKNKKIILPTTPRNQIVINTKMQLMREQEANILLLLNSISSITCFHFTLVT